MSDRPRRPPPQLTPSVEQVPGSTNRLADIIGQRAAVERLLSFGEYFQARGSTPGHILLTGVEGMGKAILAVALANEWEVAFQQAEAKDWATRGDCSGVLTNIQTRQILALENVQLLGRGVVSLLSGACRDFKLNISIGQGPSARTHTFEIPQFTLIATCPRKADCPPELLSEFALILNLAPYSRSELQAIIAKIARESGTVIGDGASELIAKCCEPRPGYVKTLLQRLVRATNKNAMTLEDVQQALVALGTGGRPEVPLNQCENLAALSGTEFEKLIAALLARMGFHAETTKASGDGGIDIEATLDKPIVGGRYLFQCKCYSPGNLVGAPTLRDFYGAVTAERAIKGIFITTSDFTAQARDFALKTGLELIDLPALQKLLSEAKFSGSTSGTGKAPGTA